MKNKYTLATLFGMIAILSYSQKGIHLKEDTKKVTITNFPTHLEYSPTLVSGLKTANGWQVSVAATGLGKPRMLYRQKRTIVCYQKRCRRRINVDGYE